MKNRIKVLFEVFDDWLTRAAALVCSLIIVIVIFNMNASLAETYPLLGTIVFAMVPALFIAGGVIFVMAILRFSRRDNNNGTTS